MHKTFKLKLAYNGKNYSGFQTQKNLPTIQTVLAKALSQITGESVVVKPSGRTDTGVHALAQFVNFTLKTKKAIARAQKTEFIHQLNCVLPDDIIALSSVPKSGFDAQKNARSKKYEYLILISPRPNPFLENLLWRLPKSLDLSQMKMAALSLIGKHDFSSFCAADSTAITRVRELLSLRITTNSPAAFFSLPGEKFIRLEFHGRGFLKQMVRNLVGTLVEVGEGKRTPGDMAKILAAQDRKKAGRTAPARGLYLKSVHYGRHIASVSKTGTLSTRK